MRLRLTRTADAGASGLKCVLYAADIPGIWFAWLRPTLSVMPIMETPLVTTVFLVLIAALWHRRFVRATRERCAEPFAKDCMRIGVVLLASGIVLFGDRVGTPTDAETLATVFFDAGGGVLLFLGAVSWATSNDAAIWLANLTGETLVFIAPDGEPLFTLHPQFGCAAVTLPPPLPGMYLIVPPVLLESEEAASRDDLRVVDPSSARRSGDSRRVLVRRLRARA